MTAVTLPADLQAWAEGKVAAGRALTIDKVTERALRGYRAQVELLRQSLDDAKAEVAAGEVYRAEDVFADLRARYADEESFDDIKAKLDLARDQVGRGEAVDGEAFLAELDGWIAHDLAAESQG